MLMVFSESDMDFLVQGGEYRINAITSQAEGVPEKGRLWHIRKGEWVRG